MDMIINCKNIRGDFPIFILLALDSVTVSSKMKGFLWEENLELATKDFLKYMPGTDFDDE